MTTDKDIRLLIKKFDDDIKTLVDAVVRQNVSCGPYNDEVYEAVRKIGKGYRKWSLVHGLFTD